MTPKPYSHYGCISLQYSQEETKTEKRAKAKELAHSFLGAFAASRKNEDWKKTKEDYLVDKYAEK